MLAGCKNVLASVPLRGGASEGRGGYSTVRYLIIALILVIINPAFSQDGSGAIVLDDEYEIEVVEDDDAIAVMPEITEPVEADCPAESIVGGSVLLQVVVSENGNVDSVDVIKSLTPVLDACVMEAVKRFKFSPAKLKSGEAVAVMLQYEYAFEPPKPKAPETAAVDAAGADPGAARDDDTAGADPQAARGDGTGSEPLDIDQAYELVVYGKEEVKEVARHRITISEVKRIPGLGGDVARVVQAMPGVARPSFGGNAVIVRGAPGWASRYYIDGMSVPMLYHMAGNLSIYPSDAIEAVDFYPGGFGTRYGGAVAGVIEMTGRASKDDKLSGYADLSMLDGALFLEGPVNENISFMVSGRRGFTGDLLNLYFKHAAPKNTPFAMAPFYRDYLLRIDAKLNGKNKAFAMFIGSRDSIGIFIPAINIGTSEIDERIDEMNTMTMFHTLMCGLDSRISEKLTNMLRMSGTWAVNRMSAFGMAKIEEEPFLSHLRNQLSYKASDKVTVNAGADIEYINESIDFVVNTPGLNVIVGDKIDDWKFGLVGGYVNVEWKPVEKLLLIPGIRYDYFIELNHRGSLIPAFGDYEFMDNRGELSAEPAFRLTGRYRLNGEHTVKAAIGSYSQTPEPMGIVIHEDLGEPNLPPTKAAQYVAGHEWQISEFLSLDAQAYYNYMWSIPRSYDARTDYNPDREIQQRYFSDGIGRTYGLELMLRHSRSEKFFGWVTYTLSRSEAWSRRDGKFILSSRDEPHHLQLLGSWKLKNNWDMGVRTRFVSGKPTSPIKGTIENTDNKNIRPIYGERNSTRMDPFFQVDLRADKKKEYDKWALTYYVDLQNVLWPLYKSPEFIFYNYNYTESQKISMIPMASSGIRVEF